MWIKHAMYDGYSTVEILYSKWLNGVGYHDHTIFVDTIPQGDWTDIKFEYDSTATVVNFLNTMVNKNLDVHRKIAQMSLDALVSKYEGTNNSKYLELMESICILDPTFTPPILNERCGWQMELLSDIVTDVSARIIATCRNMHNLDKYFKTLQLL